MITCQRVKKMRVKKLDGLQNNFPFSQDTGSKYELLIRNLEIKKFGILLTN